MSLVIGAWIIPSMITIGLWLWVFLTPVESSGNWYSWDIMPLVRGVAAIIGTLAAWLVYFIVLAVR